MINAAAERERREKRRGVVEVLELARCGVDGDGLAALVSGLADEHCSLRSLNLAGNTLGYVGFRIFSSLKSFTVYSSI